MLHTETNEWKDPYFTLGYGTRPCLGETQSGDKVLLERTTDYLLLGLIDGLGHGPAAAEISGAICAYCSEKHEEYSLSNLVTNAHEKFIGSRGAVIGFTKLFNNGAFEYVGLGNIRTRIIRKEKSTIELLSKDGALGVRMYSLNTYHDVLESGDKILMFSDGVSRRIVQDKSAFPRVKIKEFIHQAIASYGKNYDDASIIYLTKNDERV